MLIFFRFFYCIKLQKSHLHYLSTKKEMVLQKKEIAHAYIINYKDVNVKKAKRLFIILTVFKIKNFKKKFVGNKKPH